MQVNTSVSTLSFTTTSVTQNAAIGDESFENVMKSADACACKHKGFPILEQLAEIIELATNQGKITSTEATEYNALLDDIQNKLESFKDQRHACHPHREQLDMMQMSSELAPPPRGPMGGMMPINFDQNPAAFLVQTDFVAFETESLMDFKAWVNKMIEEGKLSPKAQDAITTFLALREQFVAMITDLKEAFSDVSNSATLTESEASSRLISSIVQNPAATTPIDTDSVDTETEDDTVASVATDSNSGDAATDDSVVVEETVSDTETEAETA
jgi:hypothetical protein